MTQSFIMTTFQPDCVSLPLAATTAMKSTKVKTLSAVALHTTTACMDDAITLDYSLVSCMPCLAFCKVCARTHVHIRTIAFVHACAYISH